MASIGRRQRAQVVERPGDSAAAHTRDTQESTVDEAQKIFVVREMMPKDIKREFLTGARKFEKLRSETRDCCDCGGQGHIGVNCPYTRANRKDEEDDQLSSCESEPEGENAEELTSLETHDEEGEWCWPKKGRVTRWRRRIDSRPAVHYLAEEDEDEQVSRGLNHFASRSAAGTQ